MKTARIRNRCSESWENMESQGDQKFCGSCKRTVFDLTGKSPDEIGKLWIQNQGVMCGKLPKEGMPVVLSGIQTIQKSGWRNTAAFILISLGFSTAGLAQATIPMERIEMNGDQTLRSSTLRHSAGNDPETVIIRGKVVSEESGWDFSGAKVVLSGTKIETVCKAGGIFELEIPRSELQKPGITLECFGSRYGGSIWVTSAEASTTDIEIVLMFEPRHQLGDIYIPD